MVSASAKNIILNAAKSEGRNIKKIVSYLDEKSAPCGTKEIEEFLTWSFKNRGYLRHSNFEAYYQDFLSSKN